MHIQAHRGARAAKPENTLPAFELALDLGVDSIETDLRLSCDGVVVVFHDDAVSPRLCRALPGFTLPRGPQSRVERLTLAELRTLTADASLLRRPREALPATPLAQSHFAARGLSQYAIPTLEDLLHFAREYTGDAGRRTGKTGEQQEKAARVRWDLELKGTAQPETQSAALAAVTIAAVAGADMTQHVCIRSFDHRLVKAIKEIDPRLRTGILLAGSRPVSPVTLARAANADEFYPHIEIMDEDLVREAKAAGLFILPWTVNDEDSWATLRAWRVDGFTTDHPAAALAWLSQG